MLVSQLSLQLGLSSEIKSPKLKTLTRRPSSLAIDDERSRLCVANRRSGTVSVIDLATFQVISETNIGVRLESITYLPKSNRFLAVDFDQHEVILFELVADQPIVRQRIPVAQYPVSVIVNSEATRCYVTSLWSRRLTSIHLETDGDLDATSTEMVDLPMAPKQQILVRDDSILVVADAFGDKICLIDSANLKLTSVRSIPGHNIRGLGESLDGKHLVISHQLLIETAVTNRNDIHWGLVISNDMRWVSIDVLATENESIFAGGSTHALGNPDRAAADPEELRLLPDGTIVNAISGTNELHVGRVDELNWTRIAVGRGPMAVAVSSRRNIAFTANTFDDSISVVDLSNRRVTKTIRLGPAPELTIVDQGERLFHNAKFSRDGWMTCNSCHGDGHTNGMRNDNFTDGSFGAPKRVLSLLGRAGTEPLAWNGSSQTFEQQVKASIQKTMQSPHPPTDQEVHAIAQFIRSLPAPPSIDEARGVADIDAISEGRQMFLDLGCRSCHRPPTYTTPKVYNVGIQDELGSQEFNPPSLLGVGQRGPFFHDNRATSLRSVFEEHQHRLKKPLPSDELDALLSFLRSL